MKIGIPVKCQNGHKATWVIEIVGIGAHHRGVDKSKKCACPKLMAGEGYAPDGKPFLIEDVTELLG